MKSSCAIYALGPDLAARGVTKDDLAEGMELVDYAGFVDLRQPPRGVCAWL